ncbi:hypothetical protein ACI3M0_00420 (plasmid) [Escherichia coli]|uniref:hypothetical protein n=1 Tax=Escherichia coli TaxID=562 RepID=UPI00386024C6
MGSCAAPSAKGDDKFITTDYLQQCRVVLLNQLVEQRLVGLVAFVTVCLSGRLTRRGVPCQRHGYPPLILWLCTVSAACVQTSSLALDIAKCLTRNSPHELLSATTG